MHFFFPYNAHRRRQWSVVLKSADSAVLIRWMNLEPIIQTEVYQKEKGKYHVLTNIHGIYKDDTDEFICKAAMEKQTQRTDLQTQGKGRRA